MGEVSIMFQTRFVDCQARFWTSLVIGSCFGFLRAKICEYMRYQGSVHRSAELLLLIRV